MNLRKSRRYGRQIPEYLLFGALLSLSMACGFPLTLHLRLNYPQMNSFLRMFLAIVGGFLILVALYLSIAAGTWLVWLLWRLFARKK